MTTDQFTAQRHLQLPWKLHVILENPQFESIVAWGSNGETFRIVSREDFSEVISPMFFNSNCYKSFQRSLNFWGFRATKSKHVREYMHPLFKKGQPELCNSMQRNKHRGGPSRSSKSIKASSRETKATTTTSMVSPSALSVISEDSILSALDKGLYSRAAAGGYPSSNLLLHRPPNFCGGLSSSNYQLLADAARRLLSSAVPAAAPVVPMSLFVLQALEDVLAARRHEQIVQKATYGHENQQPASFL